MVFLRQFYLLFSFFLEKLYKRKKKLALKYWELFESTSHKLLDLNFQTNHFPSVEGASLFFFPWLKLRFMIIPFTNQRQK